MRNTTTTDFNPGTLAKLRGLCLYDSGHVVIDGDET